MTETTLPSDGDITKLQLTVEVRRRGLIAYEIRRARARVGKDGEVKTSFRFTLLVVVLFCSPSVNLLKGLIYVPV